MLEVHFCIGWLCQEVHFNACAAVLMMICTAADTGTPLGGLKQVASANSSKAA